MSEDKKITIKNVSNATVSLFAPEIGLNRELRPGRIILIEPEKYAELAMDDGFNTLVRAHYLKIEGVQEEEQFEIVGTIYSSDEIAKILDTNDITAFAKFIPNAAPAEKDAVVDLAVEKRITHPAVVQLIKKYCDRDIIELINTRHADEV